jgi:hypothetical protein
VSDRQLIDAVARLWIASGGDAVGMNWCWTQIRDRIAKLEKERNEPALEREEA